MMGPFELTLLNQVSLFVKFLELIDLVYLHLALLVTMSVFSVVVWKDRYTSYSMSYKICKQKSLYNKSSSY